MTIARDLQTMMKTGIGTEITALSTIRDILRQLTEKLSESVHLGKKLDFFSDDIIGIADTLTVVKPKIKEEISMSELNQASELLESQKFNRVRIVYLPPMTVASIHRQVFQSDRNPEEESSEILDKYIADTDLENVYPQARHFGCGNPDPQYEDSERGYERWISIHDDMEVPAPLVKKHHPRRDVRDVTP